MGFPVPLNNWFNGKLRNFILDLIKNLREKFGILEYYR